MPENASLGSPAALHLQCTAQSPASGVDVYAFTLPATESQNPPCDYFSDSPVSLSRHLHVGARFATSHAQASVVCQLASPVTSQVLAYTAPVFSVSSTRWPLWDDAVVVGLNGFVRSARFGVTLNASGALQRAFASAGPNASTDVLPEDSFP